MLQRTSSRKCKDNPENERKYLQIVYLIRAYTLEYPTLQADSLPAEPQGKPKNTGVGSLIPSPRDLPDSGIKLGSPALQADFLPTELLGKPDERTIQFKYEQQR